MLEKKTVLEFPCYFPIKVLGKSSESFERAVLEIFRKYYPKMRENSLQQRASQQGTYLSLTINVFAESQAQLDHIYRALSACSEVVMVL